MSVPPWTTIASELRLATRRATPRDDRLPDFLCIGAQRAGTTLLYQMLRGHPDIFLPPCKELHALDAMAGMEPERWERWRRDFLTNLVARSWRAGPAARRKLAWARRFADPETVDMAWYASLFREARPHQRAGEITPSYALLTSSAIAAAIAQMPELKVLFILRDPIDRALSGAIHACTLAIGATRPPTMPELLAALADPGCIARSRYRATIERWTSHLPEDRFHALFFDDLVAKPAATLALVHDALGVARRPVPQARRVNANPLRVDWPVAALREIARGVVADCDWLAARYGGAARRWAIRAHTLAG